MMEKSLKKANHQANIVRITDIQKHPNADTLDIIKIGEYQVVSKIGQFKVGDLGVYIQPDSVVPQTEPFKFIWQPYLDDLMNTPGGETFIGIHSPVTVPEKKRRITVRKFRKEWSEGLLLPISDFPEFTFISAESASEYYYNPEAYYVYTGTLYQYDERPTVVTEGDDVSDLLGITHYDPDAGKDVGETSNAPKLRKKYPRSLHGWFSLIRRVIRNLFGLGSDLDGSKGVQEGVSFEVPTYDVDALKNYPNTFEDGEQVIVTEKVHGSNARFLFLDGIMYAGSRNLWKAPNSNCIFRKAVRTLPWIEEWCRAHEGYVLWGEVTPTQTGFEYGSKDVQFFPFDIRTPDGKWLDKTHENFSELVVPLLGHSVPVLYQGAYDLEKIKTLVDGPSMVPGAKNIREGVVIKTAVERHKTGVGRCQMKIVSNAYLAKDNK